MTELPVAAVVVLLGYLLGAVPFGLLIGRWTRGIDIREYGSHRTGATNALRTLGARAALAVLLLDLAKGVAAVLLARLAFEGEATEWVAAAAGFAAIVGHNWSVFIRFTGGRGVATSTGALAALVPLAALILAPVALGVMWRWRYVSLGSITGALVAPVIVAGLMLAGLAELPHLAFAAATGLLVTLAHSDNIARLRAGTERKIGQRATESTQEET
jgi:acyl phosphate:glycerol-3-phosphate acyltransferase